MLPPAVGLMRQNHLTNHYCRKSKTNLFSYGFERDIHCSNLGLPHDLTTLSPSPSHTFLPWLSAVPPELPPTMGRSHSISGSYTTHLLTDGFPSMVLTALRLVRSGRTPLLRQTLLREGRRWLKPLFFKKSRWNRKVQFYPTYLENKDRWSPQGSSSFSKGGTNTGLGKTMYSSLWLHRREGQSLLPRSFCKLSNETLLSHMSNWEQGLVWVIWPTSSWTQPFASPYVGTVHLNTEVSVTGCLDHRSLRGCQRSQLDCLRVVQTPETRERAESALEHDTEKS